MRTSLAPLANQQICHLQSERIYRIWKICRIGILEKSRPEYFFQANLQSQIKGIENWFLVDVHSNLLIFIGLGHHFGGILGSWGTTLAPLWWSLGARVHSGGPLNAPNVDFHRFFMIFEWPVGITLGSFFHNLYDLRHQKACLDCRHDSWWFLIGKIADFWCPNLSKTL